MIQTGRSENNPFWLAPALQSYMVSEVRGVKNNPEIIDYFTQAGHPNVKNDEVPWCAAYVGAMLKRSGIKSTNSLLARSYTTWGIELNQPEFGAIAVFKRGTNPTLGHVGFVVGYDRENIYLLGGNQNDQVNITPYPTANLISLRWPEKELSPHLTCPADDIFNKALSHTLELEGGWSNHKSDPGGPTNKGITLTTFLDAQKNGVISKKNKDQIDALKNISTDDLRIIYRTLYWQKAKCYLFPESIAILMFDAAVNHGPLRAIKFLQQAINAEADGEIGPQTLIRYQQKSTQEILDLLIEVRRQFYLNNKNFSIFGKGWLNRLNKISKAAANSPGQSKITKSQTKELPSMNTTQNNEMKWWGESLTIWGTIVTALSTILPVLGPFIGFDISAELIQQFGDTVAKLIQIIGGVTGTSMAIIGRTRATTSLTRRSVNVKI